MSNGCLPPGFSIFLVFVFVTSDPYREEFHPAHCIGIDGRGGSDPVTEQTAWRLDTGVEMMERFEMETVQNNNNQSQIIPGSCR